MASDKCYWVYKLTSPDGLVYIGISRNIQKRFSHYYHKTCKKQPLLYKKLLDIGFASFEKTILKTHLTKPEAIACEENEVATYKKLGISLNVSDGFNRMVDANRRQRKVAQYDLSGKFIAKFNSCEEAANSIGISSGLGISAAARTSVTNYCKGYLWYYFDNTPLIEVPAYHKQENRTLAILQFDLEGNYIKRFIGQRVAATELKINQANINTCLKGKRKEAGGFKWMYEYAYLGTKKETEKEAAVIQYDLSGNIICEYPSVIEASRKTGIDTGKIIRIACGRMKTPKPYLWRYKDESRIKVKPKYTFH